MRNAAAAWLLIGGLSTGICAAQEATQKALTAEEIRAQLAGAKSFTGQLLLDGKLLCALDSSKTQTYPLGMMNAGEPRPRTWAEAGDRPAVVVTLSHDVADRIFLVKLGGDAAKNRMQLKRQLNVALPTYSVTFPDPLLAGDYEFGETEGTLAFFFRCGFTVKR